MKQIRTVKTSTMHFKCVLVDQINFLAVNEINQNLIASQYDVFPDFRYANFIENQTTDSAHFTREIKTSVNEVIKTSLRLIGPNR